MARRALSAAAAGPARWLVEPLLLRRPLVTACDSRMAGINAQRLLSPSSWSAASASACDWPHSRTGCPSVLRAYGSARQEVQPSVCESEPLPRTHASATTPGVTPLAWSASPSAPLDPSVQARAEFEQAWQELEEELGPELHTPREIVWLNGAPGSGKGANTPFILKTRGISNPPIEVSAFLPQNPAAMAAMARGELVSDALVLALVLKALLDPSQRPAPRTPAGSPSHDEEGECHSFLVDGFPRTSRQVDYVKLLHDHLLALHRRHFGGPREVYFPKPYFSFVVLWVTEEESIRRQLLRGALAAQARERDLETGLGRPTDQRTTDLSAALCAGRYATFKNNYSSLLRLKQFFNFHKIDGMGTLVDSERQIARELRYQSSLELSESAYRLVATLPLAQDLALQARHQLIVRLDRHAVQQRPLFASVVGLVRAEIVPLLWRSALAGRATYSSERLIFSDEPDAVTMLIDVLADRGYSVSYELKARSRLARVDLITGRLHSEPLLPLHVFSIRFRPQGVRDAEPLEIKRRQATAEQNTASAWLNDEWETASPDDAPFD